MVKKILIAVIILILIGVGTGVYMFNKKPLQIEDAKGMITTTAAALTKEYSADEKKANTTYLDKAIEVSGTVSGVSRNQDGHVVVTMDSGDPMAEVQCTMRDQMVNPEKGKNIKVRGFCRGNNMGVVLNDCIIK